MSEKISLDSSATKYISSQFTIGDLCIFLYGKLIK